MSPTNLRPATELAQNNKMRFPNESHDYRGARMALLAEEIELRRHIERVAEQRRQLPEGGEVKKSYSLVGENGPVTFASLFGNHDSLIVYSFMYPPESEKPCPMCTSFMNTWDFKLKAVEERVSFIMVARSSIERLTALKKALGWKSIHVFSDTDGAYSRDYVSPKEENMPGYNVFSRKGGVIRHFWAGEMSDGTQDPGQDPRGAPDTDPLWTLLDTTPEGRGTDWYPKL